MNNRTTARLQRRQRRAAIIEDLVYTGLSLLVLVGIVAYLFMPPTISMAVDVQQQAVAGTSIIVYGSVLDLDDRAVRNASVVISKDTQTGFVQVASVTTGSDGTYRVELNDELAAYKVVVSADIGGSSAADTITTRMQPGQATQVSAVLQSEPYFLFVPIATY